jgi:plasmid stability protein
MGTITIRNLPEEVIERLKASAREHQQSMEQEVRLLLERRYSPRNKVLHRIRARWKNLPEITPEEIEKWRNEGRA